MAQSIVSTVVGKLGELLIKEVNFLQGVDEELTSLQSDFQWFQAFLKDADATIQGGNERAKTWVNQVRDVAYDAEDIIDTYIFKIHQHRRGSHGCFSSLMTTYACHPSRLTILHELGNEIGKVKRRAEEISANRSKYGIDSVGATSSGSLTSNEARLPLSWKQTPVVEEVDVIGFDEHVKTLVQLLLAEDEDWRAVISIVGMGGLGKTTLAKRVSSEPRIKQHFACHAWVYVSQAYTDRGLVKSMAKQFMVVDEGRMNNLKYEDLKKVVYEHLKERKYLVVTDDVWTRRDWDNIKEVLPEMANGSKVLLTTRNREVALHADRRSPPFDLKLLGEEESWELFCKKAIPTKCAEHCPPNLEEIGRQMVAKCSGLPLAIVVLGGLALRKEQSEEEWRKLLKSVRWQLRESEDQISKILALSYHHLPYYIKPCFLYFAMLPQDSSLINARDLMLKWIAEGFIEARDEETMEEVAEEYLEELVHRSLIQVAERNVLGGIDTCGIHDRLLDLAISEAKGMNFIHVIKNNEGNIVTLQKTRRLALHGDKSWDVAQQYPTDSAGSLRAITFFGTKWWKGDINTDTSCGKCIRKILTLEGSDQFGFGFVLFFVSWFIVGPRAVVNFQRPRILISMKLLRVIDLHGVAIILPKAIGELIHLRYLNVQVGGTKSIPSSIGELTNLQTLQIQNEYSTTKLPSAIWKLQSNLRHLECRSSCSIKGQPSADSLPNLQTLSSIKAGKWLNTRLLEKMINLRKLSICDICNSYEKALLDSLGKLNNLIELELTSEDEHEIPTSILTASHQKHFRLLSLKGKLEKLPEVNTQSLLTNLIMLTLELSELKEDPLATLGKLDNLQVLVLRVNAFVGKEMVCLERGFPQLKQLEILFLDTFEEWKIEEEAMPRLRKLIIAGCMNLVMLPHGLGKITSLQQLNVRNMPSAFTQRLRANDGDDWDKVQHIPLLEVTDLDLEED
ncbi:P-loop containing nucleoside triphosphate hydrolase protein [Dioscorea alata]|uniref:P-loop containing nucleoside triphosphate hydrolase protein n=1 Tax=Dioscorea alata TaxID=55571 RepID=A0ACB7VJM6_DIOAL|nr:P-loop containing nucleoside triphosphate hydrolase protein [Dioscorea alata]